MLLASFIASSFLLIWRLEHMTETGVEGTVLGTLVMPYCSGIGNLIFVFFVYTTGQPAAEVMTNCLVNNITNMTLMIGLPAIFWGMRIIPKPGAKAKQKRRNNKNEQGHRNNRLSLQLTLSAVLFFTGAVWALARDGKLDRSDGLVLVGLFLFWQCFHVFDVLKTKVRKNKSWSWLLVVDFILLLIGAYGTYVSIDGLVTWISNIHTGFISAKYLGWLSGWLMVLPNGLLAFYYAWRGNPEVVYASQVGDGHISITAGRQGDFVRLAVEDDGVGVPTAAQPAGNGIGLKIIAEVGINRIREKSKRQTARLIQLAEKHGWRVNSPRDPEKRGGTVSIDMPDSQEVCRELLKRDILVDWRPKAGVRISPHFYNNDEELEIAISAVEEILNYRAVAAR